MNTVLSRLNTIFAFTLSVMAGLTFLCFLSTFFNDHKALVAINTGKVIVKNVPDYSASREKNDLAEYETKDHKLNQVVVWDKIIKRGDNPILDYRKANTKYYFWDYGNGLRANKNITLTLSWNVIPNAGTLPKIMGEGHHRFEFPEDYSPNRFQ
ncbi:Signal peptidase complex subunit 3 [Mactra antiquata]